jgi:hypothetical protein
LRYRANLPRYLTWAFRVAHPHVERWTQGEELATEDRARIIKGSAGAPDVTGF